MFITMMEWIPIIQSLLTSFAIVFGGGWGYFEYEDKKSQYRINNAFEFVAKFEASEEYQNYDAFAGSDAVYIILNAKDVSEQLVKLHTEEKENQLKRLIEMHHNAVICVEVNHCDKEVIATFMAPVSHTVFVIGYGIIDKLRKRYNDPEYACDLVKVSEWYCNTTANKSKPVLWCKNPEPVPCGAKNEQG